MEVQAVQNKNSQNPLSELLLTDITALATQNAWGLPYFSHKTDLFISKIPSFGSTTVLLVCLSAARCLGHHLGELSRTPATCSVTAWGGHHVQSTGMKEESMRFPRSLLWEGTGWKGRLGCCSSFVVPETLALMGDEHAWERVW